jgi:hypothetical protein
MSFGVTDATSRRKHDYNPTLRAGADGMDGCVRGDEKNSGVTHAR